MKNKSNLDGTKTKINEQSILEKNISSGTKEDYFKVIIKNLVEADFKKFKEVKPGNIFSSNFAPTPPTVVTLKSIIKDQEKDKIDNFYITISPISEDLIEAVKYLIGCLSDKKISVDNNQGRAIIAELSLRIDEKAEIKVKNTSNYELKYIDSTYLSSIFITCEKLNYFDDVLHRADYSLIKSQRIKKARLKIELTHTALKEQIKDFITCIEDLEDYSEKEIIKKVTGEFNSTNSDHYILTAIAIECICEIGEE